MWILGGSVNKISKLEKLQCCEQTHCPRRFHFTTVRLHPCFKCTQTWTNPLRMPRTNSVKLRHGKIVASRRGVISQSLELAGPAYRDTSEESGFLPKLHSSATCVFTISHSLAADKEQIRWILMTPVGGFGR